MLANIDTQTPTVVYRTRSLDEATNLAAYLTERNINARVAVQQPQGYFGEIPITDFVHEIMAVDYDADATKKYILEWETLRRDLKLESKSPYCYHCGQTLAAQTAACPACGQSLQDAD